MAKKNVRIGSNSAAPELIKSVIARVEKLQEEKDNIGIDIREVFSEAKGNGLDVKVLKDLIKMRKQDAADRSEHNAMLGIYGEVIGIDPFS